MRRETRGRTRVDSRRGGACQPRGRKVGTPTRPVAAGSVHAAPPGGASVPDPRFPQFTDEPYSFFGSVLASDRPALLALLACSEPEAPAPNPDAFDERIGEDADLTPMARAVEQMLAAGERVPPVAELAFTLGEEPPPSSEYDFTPPETIRVWRSSRGGSSSCSGDVEVMDFDDYVKGVLPREWIRSWETESLRAGAVAIRSYAAWWVNAGGKYTCADICDTTSCQVYDEATYSNTDAAVDDTEGEYVVEGRDLVFAEFSAENGDPTAYGVSDPYCSGEAVFGHGRGVCQWGSQRWALYGGKEHSWIVEHYYPGAFVVVVGVDEDGEIGRAHV